jgi:hypothetical protein
MQCEAGVIVETSTVVQPPIMVAEFLPNPIRVAALVVMCVMLC